MSGFVFLNLLISLSVWKSNAAEKKQSVLTLATITDVHIGGFHESNAIPIT